MTEPPSIPVVCDMTTATDTTEERLADYRRLFGSALVGRERTADRIAFRFAADDGVEALVRDLAASEHDCCSFMFFDVTATHGEVRMAVTVVDDDTAHAVLDEYHRLPESLAGTDAEMFARFADLGLDVIGLRT